MQFNAVLSWCTYSSDVSSICICLQYYELIKYSDTLASANAVNEKSHCGAIIIWQSIWFPLSLGRYDKRDFVVRRLPRIRSQRTSEKASARRCCRNENEKTWAPDFSVVRLVSSRSFIFLTFFPSTSSLSVYTGFVFVHLVAWQFFSVKFLLRHEQTVMYYIGICNKFF